MAAYCSSMAFAFLALWETPWLATTWHSTAALYSGKAKLMSLSRTGEAGGGGGDGTRAGIGSRRGWFATGLGSVVFAAEVAVPVLAFPVASLFLATKGNIYI